jgi:hypothetical protein
VTVGATISRRVGDSYAFDAAATLRRRCAASPRPPTPGCALNPLTGVAQPFVDV